MIIFKNIIDFEISDNFFVIANDKQLLDASKNETLLSFENSINLGSIVLGDNLIFAGDIYGQEKVKTINGVKILPFAVRDIIDDDNSFIAHLNSPKRTARVDLSGSVIWEVNFRSIRYYLVKNEIIILEDKRIIENQKLMIINLDTGDEICNIEFGNSLPKVIGDSLGVVWIASQKLKFIRAVELETGQVLDEISGSVISTILDDNRNNIDLEYFKLDKENSRLVHPYGDIDLKSKNFRRRVYFDHIKTTTNIWVPYVFPFLISSKYLIFGIQEDDPKTKETKTQMIVIDRKTEEVCLERVINKQKPNAGMKKIILKEDKLFFIDSYNNLHCVNLIEHII